jgi:hypothetical protein
VSFLYHKPLLLITNYRKLMYRWPLPVLMSCFIEILLKVALNTIAPTLILYHRIILRKFEDTQGVSRSRESIFENKMNNKKNQKNTPPHRYNSYDNTELRAWRHMFYSSVPEYGFVSPFVTQSPGEPLSNSILAHLPYTALFTAFSQVIKDQ